MLAPSDPSIWFAKAQQETIVPRVVVRRQDADKGQYSVHTTGPVSSGDILFIEQAFAYAPALAFFDNNNGINNTTTTRTVFEQFVLASAKPGVTELADALLNFANHDRETLCALDFACAFHEPPLDPATAPLAELAEDISIAYGVPLTLSGSHVLYAKGLFHTACRVNHSCEPNCAYLAHSDWVLFYATRDMPAGEELTWTYLGEAPDLPLAIRQEHVRTQLHFDCHCTRCQRETRDPIAYSPAYFDLRNKTQRWRLLVFTQIGVNVHEMPASYEKPYALTKVFLAQNDAEIRRNPLVLAYVGKALVRLLLVFSPSHFLKPAELVHWMNLHAVALPYMHQPHTRGIWRTAINMLYDALQVAAMVFKADLAHLPDVAHVPVGSAFAGLEDLVANQYLHYTPDARLLTFVRKAMQLVLLAKSKK